MTESAMDLKQLVAKLAGLITDDPDLQAFIDHQLRAKHRLASEPSEENEIEHANYYALETHLVSHVLNCVIASLDHSYGVVQIGAEHSDDLARQ